jgi:serine phosphatase RsbU (regulator of sigma subunit)
MSHRQDQQAARGWPQQHEYKRSIRLEFSLYLSITIVVLMLVTGYVITDHYVKTVTENVVDKLLVQARSFSTAASKHLIGREQPDDLMLTTICRRFVSENPDVFWVGIAGKDRRYLAHTDIKKVISQDRMTLPSSNEYTQLLHDGEELGFAHDTIDLAIPIVENDIVLGQLALGASSRRIAEARNLSITAVASVTIIMLLLGIPITMVVVNRKLRPISLISRQLQKIDPDQLTMELPIRTRDEFGYLAETLRYMADRVREAREQAIENERVQKEYEIAHEIQSNILPRQYPESPLFEFAGAYESAREIGGDYYDFVEHDERHLGFLIADVSGKSLPGMLVMLLTRDIVKNVARMTADPAELMSRVNSELLTNIRKGMFVTMSYAVLDKSTGRVTFASAGHNPLILFSQNSETPTLIKTKGFPLGLMPDEQFRKRIERHAIDLKPGDILVQYTDGVNEAHNAAGEEFGVDRFVTSIKERRTAMPSELIRHVLHTHNAFVGSEPQFDDITVLVVRWNGTRVSAPIHGVRETSRVN